MAESNSKGVDLLTGAEWSDTSRQLKELLTTPVPNIVKVTKGQYRDIGVAKTVSSELYVHSIRTTRKVLAEGVKVKDGKRLLQTDQRFSMPVSYQGWFELLSEDGKAIKALQSVQDLVRVLPQSCLVRDNMKGYIYRENGELAVDRQRSVHAGELLTLAGEITVPMVNGKHSTQKRLLKCFDAKGESVFLGFEQKGMFSPVAGHANISGVHSIKALITKFRFPILVRLVHGIIPTKVERSFTGVFRLTSVFSDETAFVCPLKKDAKMVPISTREPLKVILASNVDSLLETDEAKNLQRKCTQMITSYMNSIHVLVSMPDPSLLAAGVKASEETKQSKKSDPNHRVASSAVDANQDEEDILFLEIEDIYHYVREGGIVPPPPRPRPNKKQHVSKPDKDGVAKVMANTNQATAVKATAKPTAAVSPNAQSAKRESTERLSAGEKSQGDNASGENILWEEPIYEPLDKIRELKKKVQEIEQTIVFEKDFAERAAQSKSSKVPKIPVASPQKISTDSPVSNLRQVIKQKNQMDANSPDTEPMKKPTNVPPIPPKHFEKTKSRPLSPNPNRPYKSSTPVSPRHQTPPPHGGVVNISIHGNDLSTSLPSVTKIRSPAANKKRRAPLPPQSPTSPSSTPLHGPVQSGAFRAEGPRPTNVSAERYPAAPFVAVARVGNGGHRNPPRGASTKVQSMYL